MTAALETIGLGKRYGLRRWALRDLDLAVAEGSITALVGPNGAGKSTLLKAWVGFERPTAGRLRIHGVDPVRQRGKAIALTGCLGDSRRRLGWRSRASALLFV